MPGETPLVAFPLVLPMGWTESPPYFCVATETVADLANQKLEQGLTLPSHRLELRAEAMSKEDDTDPTFHASVAPRDYAAEPVTKVDVYLNDIIGIAQGASKARKRVTRAILHSLDEVIRPLEDGDSKFRTEPCSLKKLDKGDGSLSTSKETLGWLIDTRAMTIVLTERRHNCLLELLAQFPREEKRVSVQEWQNVLGELRSMSMAIPGSRGLFSTLQTAFKPGQHRLRLTIPIHDFLDNLRWTVQHLHL